MKVGAKMGRNGEKKREKEREREREREKSNGPGTERIEIQRG